ncbi:hypothetical protein YPPY47_3759 [Yersinia pestis PY-47]|nr:hypothetical protein YPPY06_3703 [Yersinia pestis PY-06]EIS01608.1 hypothetical protein YPPY47_3759 [Yersinia pestis PY-47]EIS65146.1 hypothetical protein YPPY65_3695 [Yersinia pestis PY-65]EIT39295.1 hypothetical protein YPPY99_3772 [Yersinia pestis PY-99]EIT56724.1 hypothetical protein YPPY113_3776 [Yersinia pestis PY-113]
MTRECEAMTVFWIKAIFRWRLQNGKRNKPGNLIIGRAIHAA